MSALRAQFPAGRGRRTNATNQFQEKGGASALSKDLYDLMALAGRYVFAALMVLIVLRAWRITIVDNRRARRLRQLAPQTGLSGELVVLEGGEKAKKGMRYPVIREGIIGSSRRADVRIRHSSVRRIHAFFELTAEGLKLRAHGGADLSESWGEPVRSLLLRDGDTVELGGVQLLLVLSGGEGGGRVAAPGQRPDARDELFEPADERPQGRARPAARRARPSETFDDYDDEGTLADELFADRPRGGEGLFSAREFPEAGAKRPRKRPARSRVDSPVAARTQGGKRRPRGDADEDLWL